MKKLVVAIAKETELDDAMKKKVEQFAQEHDAAIQGIMQYPDGLSVMVPQIVIDGIKNTGADCVVAASSDFLISELIHDSHISKTLRQEKIETYDLEFGMKFDEIMSRISPEFKNEFQGNAGAHVKEGKNILLISGENQDFDMLSYVTELTKNRNIAQLGQLQVHKFNQETANEVRKIIKEENMSEVIFYDEFDTRAYDDLIDELENSDIEVSYRLEEQKMPFGMILN